MSSFPSIDIVVIGLNSEATLSACLKSVKSCAYPQDKLLLFYADGGSQDASITVARSFGCTCVHSDAKAPTPGGQRNAGWRLGSAKYVQFLDSDTIMDSEWLGKAVAAMQSPDVGAVTGNRSELKPKASVFNWLGDLEWKAEPGETDCFGGDVLVARAVLEETGGYNPRLIAGEDPELSYRIRRAGYTILKLDEPMTKHDLAMVTLKQYCRRAFRSGHAYAEVHSMHRKVWRAEVRRIVLRSAPIAAATAVLPLCIFQPWISVLWAVCLAILMRPRLILAGKFEQQLGLSRREARIYAWHASLVVLPQFLGMLRFYAGRVLSRPLTNARMLSRGGTRAVA